METHHGVLEPGIYRLYQVNMFGGKKQKGVGTVVNNVLHTSWHVTVGARVVVNNRYILPFQESIENDVVTYNGVWQGKGGETEVVQLCAIPPGSHMERDSITPGEAAVMFSGCRRKRLTIKKDYPPGTSGSPIVNSRGELIGVYGFGIYANDGEYVSFISKIDKDQIIQPSVDLTGEEEECAIRSGRWEWNCLHPSGGKTTRVIKRVVELAKANGRKTLVLAPTRVVKDQLLKQLKEFGATDSVKRKSLVSVGYHATYYMDIMQGKNKKFDLYVMDEAHYKDPMSIALRGWLKSEVDQGRCSALLCTATPPGEDGSCGSNYPILEERIHVSDIPQGNLLLKRRTPYSRPVNMQNGSIFGLENYTDNRQTSKRLSFHPYPKAIAPLITI